jgi:hypothetical protein
LIYQHPFFFEIYKINIFTGEYEIFTQGLNYPEDIEVWRIKE